MTPEEFTKHVGALTFAEAVDVLLRTKEQDEDKIAEMFAQVKGIAAERDTARAEVARLTKERDDWRTERDQWQQEASRLSGELEKAKEKMPTEVQYLKVTEALATVTEALAAATGRTEALNGLANDWERRSAACRRHPCDMNETAARTMETCIVQLNALLATRPPATPLEAQ